MALHRPTTALPLLPIAITPASTQQATTGPRPAPLVQPHNPWAGKEGERAAAADPFDKGVAPRGGSGGSAGGGGGVGGGHEAGAGEEGEDKEQGSSSAAVVANPFMALVAV